ncbi:MAG: universal stress protein [Solirubrobacteraceae bacterium]
MRSIVVLIDQRPETSVRVREAVELALRARAWLTLLAVIPPVRTFSWSPLAPVVESPRALQEACEREREALLRRFVAAVPAVVSVTMTARRGRPYAALLDEVREHDHDLVLLGAGHRGLLGPLSRAMRLRFVQRCPTPVLTISGSARSGPASALQVSQPSEPARADAPRRQAFPARTRRRARA